jgi:hypothetical protein
VRARDEWQDGVVSFVHPPRLSLTVGCSLLSGVLLLGGCAAEPISRSTPPPTAGAPTASSVPASPTPDAVLGPVESFRAWLEASRKPDADAACAQLTPALQERMITELNASGVSAVTTCAEMITATAELYRALAQSAEVDVTVESETSADATLFVTYVDSGDCGTVVMEKSAARWMITELSQECAE